jgi:hypothetical protein
MEVEMRLTGDTAEMSERIGVTVRRVRQLEELGVLIRNAKKVFEIEWNANRYRVFADGSHDESSHEIERAARDLDAAFDRLRAERNADKRRKMAPEVGPLVGRLDAALRLAAALASPALRPLIERAVVADSGRVLAEFAALVGLTIEDGGK